MAEQSAAGMKAPAFVHLLGEVYGDSREAIDLGGATDVSMEQFMQVCHALRTNSSVQSLQIWTNIGPLQDVASARAVADMLSINRTITLLDIMCWPTDAGSAAELARALQHHGQLEDLRFHSFSFSQAEWQTVFNALHHCKQLRKLTIRQSASAAAEVLPPLIRLLSELNELILTPGELHGALLRPLLAVLAEHQAIRCIEIRCDKFDEHDARWFTVMLRRNRSITGLRLRCWPEDAHCVAELASGLLGHPMLEVLALDEERFSPAGWQSVFTALHICAGLRELTLLDCRNLEGAGMDALAALLPRTTLAKLELFRCALNGNPLQQLLKSLANHPTLLRLDCERFEADDARCLADMLAANHNITELLLLFGEQADTVVAADLARGLREHLMLQSLELYGAAFCSKNWQLLFAALHDTKLQVLRLDSTNRLDGDAVAALITLCSAGRLTHLNVSLCSMHGAPLQQLTAALSKNTTLRILDLSINKLNDDDACCIADMLSVNGALTELSIAGNRDIGAAGGALLADAVRSNRNLARVNADGCNLSVDDEHLIAACVRRNRQHKAAQQPDTAAPEQPPRPPTASEHAAGPRSPEPKAAPSLPAAFSTAARRTAEPATCQQDDGGLELDGPCLSADAQLQQMREAATAAGSGADQQTPLAAELTSSGDSQGQEQSSPVDWSQCITEPAVAEEQQRPPVDWGTRSTEPTVPDLAASAADFVASTAAVPRRSSSSAGVPPVDWSTRVTEPCIPDPASPNLSDEAAAFARAAAGQPYPNMSEKSLLQ